MEIDPRSLPELSKPSREEKNLRKTKKIEVKICEDAPGSLTSTSMWGYGFGGPIHNVAPAPRQKKGGVGEDGGGVSGADSYVCVCVYMCICILPPRPTARVALARCDFKSSHDT